MSETRDQAQTRRRWITLAEVVAVAGVVIAALTLYSNWQDRREAAADKAVAAASATRDKTRFQLRGTPDDDKRAIVLARSEAHPLGDIRVTFPTGLGVSPQDSVKQTIEADWFDDGLRKATDGGADDLTGRLPVLIRYTYFTDDVPTTRQAIYDIVWQTRGQRFQGRKVELLDLRLRESGGSQQRVDALWAKDRPAA
ncbi:hypothetical protein M9979_02110 [Sphingomonas sp. RP10(2022)]|uniref:Uncharacterized protein n=1 Tax=Sphingomonas liriopis TaxID=2949094 RepID=A0A9X2KP82_9SPHN|nr:hypothetical protein [Sphingomonas liriopis]MCP3733677.1 hypothetical protein [Sphingomonas liriopis]